MSENSIPESFKMTELGLLPEEWGVVKLGDIANFKNGINFTKDQKGKSGILTIDVFNMYSEGVYVNLNNLYRVNKQINDDYLLQNGDILFVRSSLKREGVGWTSLFRETQEPVTFCGFVIRARLKSDSISPEFLTNYLRTNNARENLIASSGKVAITNINQGMLGRIFAPLPPLPEQQKIAEVLSTVQQAREKTNAVISATKAFLVAVDREACALYKAELDKHLPAEYSTVVYSPGYNDPPELAKYHLSTEEEKRIRKAFRKPDELPKILIVTEKLLTGFDAPILYCMYLDKPMRDHVLLQAIARVNRPYEDEDGRKKPSGFVLDFVGIFDKLEKALAFDSQDIEGVINDIAVLKERFIVLIEHARQSYISLIDRKTQDKAVEAVLQHFMDEEKRHEYYLFFKEIADIYDILSPDAFLRPYIADMETLTRMYKILREAYEPGIAIDKSFSRKTAKLVQAHTKTGTIKPALKIYEINEYTVKKIEESTAYDTEKVFNLIRSIEKTIKKDITQKPYLIPIGERAEQITMLFKERQKNSQETLEELKALIEEINAAKKEQAERDMPVEIFSIFWLFKNEGIEKPEDKANQMRRVLEQYPHWRTSERHEREVKRELYSVLFQAGITDTHMITTLGQKTMNVLKGGSG